MSAQELHMRLRTHAADMAKPIIQMCQNKNIILDKVR